MNDMELRLWMNSQNVEKLKQETQRLKELN